MVSPLLSERFQPADCVHCSPNRSICRIQIQIQIQTQIQIQMQIQTQIGLLCTLLSKQVYLQSATAMHCLAHQCTFSVLRCIVGERQSGDSIVFLLVWLKFTAIDCRIHFTFHCIALQSTLQVRDGVTLFFVHCLQCNTWYSVGTFSAM